MSVVLQNNVGSAISYTDIMFSKPQAMQQLVTKIIHNQADARIEILLDCQEEKPQTELTRSAVNASLAILKEDARCMIADMLMDLSRELNEALDRAVIKTHVTSMEFASDGMVENVGANLSVTYTPKGA